MGIFSGLFGNKNPTSKHVFNFSVNGLTPVFLAFGSDFLNSETCQMCVRTNASYASKIVVKSVRETDDGKVSDYPELDFLLQLRPNPTMNAATFWERVRTFYDLYNNAFVYIERDINYYVKSLWALNPSSVEFGKANNGEWLLRFHLDGQDIIAPYDQVMHIARNVVSSELWGDNNSAILRVLELINTNYQGIENAIKTSAVIRFWAEVPTKLDRTSLKKIARDFTKDYLQINPDDPIGIAMADSMMKLTPIDTSKQKTANFQEQRLFDEKVYKFFGCPERIVSGIANEEERASYIEREQEPFFNKIAQEATYKLFTRREIGHRNKIIVQYNKFEHYAPKTRLEFFQAAKELGVATIGKLGEMLGFDVPKEMYNKVLVSQNYQGSLDKIPVNANGESGTKESDNGGENG